MITLSGLRVIKKNEMDIKEKQGKSSTFVSLLLFFFIFIDKQGIILSLKLMFKVTVSNKLHIAFNVECTGSIIIGFLGYV